MIAAAAVSKKKKKKKNSLVAWAWLHLVIKPGHAETDKHTLYS